MSYIGRYAKDKHGALHIISENTEQYLGNQLTLCDAPVVDKDFQDFLKIKMTSTQEMREYAAQHGLTLHPQLPEGKARQMLNDHMEAVFKEKALEKQKKADAAQAKKEPVTTNVAPVVAAKTTEGTGNVTDKVDPNAGKSNS